MKKYHIVSVDMSFNEHPREKIGVILYFSGCNKGAAGHPCTSKDGIPCHNPTLFFHDEEHMMSWEDLKNEIDSYVKQDLIDIESIIYCGGEPLDNLDELNELTKLIHEEYPKLEQVLFTHYSSLSNNLNCDNITWVKYGEWGKTQYYENLKTGEHKELYHVD